MAGGAAAEVVPEAAADVLVLVDEPEETEEIEEETDPVGTATLETDEETLVDELDVV